jgi:hypothetical protein
MDGDYYAELENTGSKSQVSHVLTDLWKLGLKG